MWVELADLDFSPETGTRKLTLVDHPGLAGDQSANFRPAAPFKFLAPAPTK